MYSNSMSGSKTTEVTENFQNEANLSAFRVPFSTVIGLAGAEPLGISRDADLQFAKLDDDEDEKLQMMRNPVDLKTSLRLFGLLMGLITPLTLLSRIATAGGYLGEPAFMVTMGVLMTATGAIAGWAMPNLFIGAVERSLSQSFSVMFLVSCAIGLLWGLLAGGCSGLWCFLIGLIPGSIAGAIVGLLTFPLFLIFYRFDSAKSSIEFSHLLPITWGLALVVGGFILGF